MIVVCVGCSKHIDTKKEEMIECEACDAIYCETCHANNEQCVMCCEDL